MTLCFSRLIPEHVDIASSSIRIEGVIGRGWQLHVICVCYNPIFELPQLQSFLGIEPALDINNLYFRESHQVVVEVVYTVVFHEAAV